MYHDHREDICAVEDPDRSRVIHEWLAMEASDRIRGEAMATRKNAVMKANSLIRITPCHQAQNKILILWTKKLPAGIVNKRTSRIQILSNKTKT